MSRLVEKTIEDVRLQGFSLAGEESVLIAPEYNVCFDIGRAPRESVSIDHVCLSHGHMDHAAGIAYYFSQRTFVGNAPGHVMVHRGLAGAIQKLMGVWADIEGHPSPGVVQGVEPLEDVVLRRGLVVRPFDVNHCSTALGFTLVDLRHKLKPEFQGKSGPQLVALKRQGVPIEDRVEVPILTYTGDTALGRWMDYSFVRRSRIVVVECTFFERDHLHRAREGKHLHVVDLPQIFQSMPEARILLMHVTRRTDLRLAKRILEKAVPPADLGRCQFLMERPPRPDRARNRGAPAMDAADAPHPSGRAGGE